MRITFHVLHLTRLVHPIMIIIMIIMTLTIIIIIIIIIINSLFLEDDI